MNHFFLMKLLSDVKKSGQARAIFFPKVDELGLFKKENKVGVNVRPGILGHLAGHEKNVEQYSAHRFMSTHPGSMYIIPIPT